jgi:hypothetical protein
LIPVSVLARNILGDHEGALPNLGGMTTVEQLSDRAGSLLAMSSP